MIMSYMQEQLIEFICVGETIVDIRNVWLIVVIFCNQASVLGKSPRYKIDIDQSINRS